MAETLAQLFLEKVRDYPDLNAQYSKNGGNEFKPTTYRQLLEEVASFAEALTESGVKRGDRVGLISDNRKEWLITDLALLGLGAADVPRGCDATDQEVRHILSWSECRLTVVENDKQLKRVIDLRGQIPLLEKVIVYDPVPADLVAEAKKAKLEVRTYAQAMEEGKKLRSERPGRYEKEAAAGKRDETATLIYTSGTTGEPKGVMLTHGNFLYQTDFILTIIDIKPGHIFLSVLPIWHSFERIAQYMILAAGAGVAYSKPIGAIMLADLQTIKPQWMASVPRIWESVKDGIYRNIRQTGGVKAALFHFFVAVGSAFSHFKNQLLGLLPDFGNRVRILDIVLPIIPLVLLAPLNALGGILVFKKIKHKLGGNFIAGISGGGALPSAVDQFFGALGVLILEGYGLTETAPVLGVRPQHKPVLGTVGPALKGTEIKIVGENGVVLPAGHKGLILVKGPQVMKGYYKRPDLTEKVLSADGWLDTGDLGMLTRSGEIKITGRAKDTIVLLGGENIEPLPIEQKLCESEYIKQTIVLGQDKKFLAALIVPDADAINAWAKDNHVYIVDYETLLQQPEVQELLDSEVKELVSPKNGFKNFERIFRFKLLPVPFEVGRELSAKQEIKRHVINEIYAKDIAALFRD